MSYTQNDEQDWSHARTLADRLEEAINKGEAHQDHARNLINHIRRITPATKPAATNLDTTDHLEI